MNPRKIIAGDTVSLDIDTKSLKPGARFEVAIHWPNGTVEIKASYVVQKESRKHLHFQAMCDTFDNQKEN